MAQAALHTPKFPRWNVGLSLALDILLAAVALLSIYYFNYRVPHRFGIPETAAELLSEASTARPTVLSPALDLGSESSPAATRPPEAIESAAEVPAVPVVSTPNSYQSEDLSISVTAHQIGQGDSTITYYVADVRTSNVDCFRTYFAQDTYGSGFTEHLTDMSKDVGAVLAMNGDSYCYNRQHTAGVLIRNGMLYRAEPTTSDVCILYKSGEMKTYSPEEFDWQQAMQDGAWQSWTFGPMLLDAQGKALTTFNTWDYIRKPHPRSAIGYYEPGHYCLVVVDGRQQGYSIGMTLPELAKVFEDLGCTAAYNLDGGHSTFLTMQGEVVNSPYKPDHKIVDCLYFGEVQ